MCKFENDFLLCTCSDELEVSDIEWVFPEHKTFDWGEKEELKNAMIEWSAKTKNAIQFDS